MERYKQIQTYLQRQMADVLVNLLWTCQILLFKICWLGVIQIVLNKIMSCQQTLYVFFSFVRLKDFQLHNSITSVCQVNPVTLEEIREHNLKIRQNVNQKILNIFMEFMVDIFG